MNIGRPLTPDPKKAKEWQARSQAAAIQRLRDRGAKMAPTERPVKKPRYNDSKWRADVMLARGEVCRSCGDTRHIEADHIIPKSQDGSARHDVPNGLPLCGSFSSTTPGGCHARKTNSQLQFQYEWLDQDQIEYLAEKGWVAWDEAGEPYGRGMKHFQPRRSRLVDEKGGHHGKGITEGSKQPVYGSTGPGGTGGRTDVGADGRGSRSPW